MNEVQTLHMLGMCVCVCVPTTCLQVSVKAKRGQKFQVVARCPMWVLGTKPGSSQRAVGFLTAESHALGYGDSPHCVVQASSEFATLLPVPRVRYTSPKSLLKLHFYKILGK